MTVHLYTLCWNDGPRLSFFFRHYDAIVDHYVIYDDGSDAATLARLKAHPRVEVRRFVRSDPTSFVRSEQDVSNQCWKESRGHADWVIVADIDELLWHRDLPAYLARCKRDGITAIPALGFQMINVRFPAEGTNLPAEVIHGMPWLQMMKLAIFDPSAIDEINFSPGRHEATPTGRVVYPPTDELLLLHYKYLGLWQTFRRHRALAGGLGSFDIANRLGFQYLWSFREFLKAWRDFYRRSVDYRTFADGNTATFPIPRWWRKA
jgi:Glycosyl transferase family 2